MMGPTGRRLRISSEWKPGSPYSRDVVVRDADTGETVRGVTHIVLTLDVNVGFNQAEVTYYETGDNGGAIVGKDGKLIKETATVENTDIDDITAFEIMDEIRRTN